MHLGATVPSPSLYIHHPSESILLQDKTLPPQTLTPMRLPFQAISEWPHISTVLFYLANGPSGQNASHIFQPCIILSGNPISRLPAMHHLPLDPRYRHDSARVTHLHELHAHLKCHPPLSRAEMARGAGRVWMWGLSSCSILPSFWRNLSLSTRWQCAIPSELR